MNALLRSPGVLFMRISSRPKPDLETIGTNSSSFTLQSNRRSVLRYTTDCIASSSAQMTVIRSGGAIFPNSPSISDIVGARFLDTQSIAEALTRRVWSREFERNADGRRRRRRLPARSTLRRGARRDETRGEGTSRESAYNERALSVRALEFARERVRARVAARGRCVSRLLARASMSAARMDERADYRAFARWGVSVHSEGAFKKVSRAQGLDAAAPLSHPS